MITPAKPMWMSGYGAPNHPAEGKLADLWVKALVLEDQRGTRGLLLTIDLVGISRSLSDAVRDEIAARWHIPRANILLRYRIRIRAPWLKAT